MEDRERLIFVHILLQAFKDIHSQSRKACNKAYKINAKQFLYSDNFKTVCDLAGYINYEEIRENILNNNKMLFENV